MKLISKTLLLFMLFILVTAASCKEEYPDLDDGLYAEIVTSKDTMIAKLFFKKVPVTVANFVALAEGTHPMVAEEFKGKPFYDSLTFHRVMDKFMIQGGDHTGTGAGNAGYKFGDEFHPDLKHDKPGILSMANSGPGTNGSQFFITEVPYPSLDNRHAVFGELVKGLDVQDSISNVKVGPRNKPIDDVIILKLNILRKGSDAKSFNASKVYIEGLPKLKEKQEAAREEALKKAEEEKKAKEAKIAEAAKTFKPILEDYNAKAKTLPSGLKMHLITEGNGPKPKEGANVKVNYEGYFTDGRLFDSNVKEVEEKYGMLNPMKVQRKMYAPMPMQITPNAQMIPGFREAAASLKVGDKAFFYIPSHLAYGERGRGAIKPNTDLTFILEMVEIVE
ncbi:peptidylprolyl isomerase [Ichthyenterobacterium magnum]|uniref:peptidylprolyl isomerase n=1 Tax=Ichthyenterobacterium magnum TaxID=1230530 RepID=A0A420DGW1_9FLAO|nr:peptidylprolyl isomerase [Ichthyenterobacterium magnum]RKE92322.1 cyclophilin family peptidyl-prolyl cis-trans isomerase [Ichthyenterobacterium magnum]